MTSSMTDDKKLVLLANLKAGYTFVLLPFIILVLIKLFHDKSWEAIFLAGDWSLASCILFGQNIASLSKAVVSRNKEVRASIFVYYFSKRLIGVVVSLVVYVLMLFEPNLILGGLQVAIFIWASVRYFTDGIVTEMLNDGK
ncbi:hypothetical protein [Marisediminitalea sp.]|uniref:hypothetical protein n=1 Tax=Marisediminitalea sp. TaxID=2662268 RepID=UPI00351347F4